MSSDVELSDTGDDTAPVNDQGTAASAPDNDSLRVSGCTARMTATSTGMLAVGPHPHVQCYYSC
jgi:hypothetical protein